MPRSRDILDFRVAQTIEYFTRKSTEEDEASPAIRWYAKFVGTGERNLYKLIQRAVNYGFSFGLSLNFERLSMSPVVVVGDGVDFDGLRKMKGKTFDGMDITMYYSPLACGDSLKKLASNGFEVHPIRLIWGSRPALASMPFLEVKPVPKLNDEVKKAMERVVREAYEEGPPRVWGRRYPFDATTMAVLEAADEDSIKSIASIARELGIESSKAQRKFYNLWSRRVILGYRVNRAPYFDLNHVIAVVETSDPLRLSYSLPVLPSVVWAAVASDINTGENYVLVNVTGQGEMISETLRLVRSLKGNVKKLYSFYLEEERYLKTEFLELKEPTAACLG